MPLDLQKYLHHLDKFDLTEDQKEELILTVHAHLERCLDEMDKGLAEPLPFDSKAHSTRSISQPFSAANQRAISRQREQDHEDKI